MCVCLSIIITLHVDEGLLGDPLLHGRNALGEGAVLLVFLGRFAVGVRAGRLALGG